MILEKITDLVRVYNEFPCKRFLLSSSGLIQSLTPNMLGVYTLSAIHLFNDRLVYVRETPSESLALVSGFDPDTREYDSWMVRYAILIKHSIFLRFNHLTIKVFNSFFINLQIVRENLNSYEDLFSSRPVLNRDCRDKELPANGDCDDGWYVMINSTHMILDETASIECLECKI